MKGHMEDGKFHPHTEYKKATRKKRLDYTDEELIANAGVKIDRKKGVRLQRDPKIKRTGIKLVGDMFKDSKTISKARHKDFEANAKIYNDHPFDRINVKQSLDKDLEWNNKHPKFSFNFIGQNNGSPSVDYLSLMKKMGISNVSNWEQWRTDGNTDKEIFDLFLQFENASASHGAGRNVFNDLTAKWEKAPIEGREIILKKLGFSPSLAKIQFFQNIPSEEAVKIAKKYESNQDVITFGEINQMLIEQERMMEA